METLHTCVHQAHANSHSHTDQQEGLSMDNWKRHRSTIKAKFKGLVATARSQQEELHGDSVHASDDDEYVVDANPRPDTSHSVSKDGRVAMEEDDVAEVPTPQHHKGSDCEQPSQSSKTGPAEDDVVFIEPKNVSSALSRKLPAKPSKGSSGRQPGRVSTDTSYGRRVSTDTGSAMMNRPGGGRR